MPRTLHDYGVKFCGIGVESLHYIMDF